MIANKKLSNLSNIPPCPGINSLEFLRLFFLLKYDSIISPKKEEKIIKKIKKIKNVFKFISKIREYNKLIKKEKNTPPNKPSYVLFGLIFNNLFLPKNLPTI